MTTDHSDIVEIVTCSKKRVNLLLERNYRLLAVECESVWAKPPKDVTKVKGYVLRFLTFIVGCTVDVERFDSDAKPGLEAGIQKPDVAETTN